MKQSNYIAFAPLQGYTDAAYRRAHWECVGGVDEYYTPFIRMEQGKVRRKDLRDTDPESCAGVPMVPQVIANCGDEFSFLCDALQQQGWRRIDLNMGCPFPMQVRAGRGSGLLQHCDRVEEIMREMHRRPEVTFSVKMRAGQENFDECLSVMPVVNAMPLLHVVLHPRLGRQQYKGMPNREAFMQIMETCVHPMVYNGDIVDIDDCGLNLTDGKIKGVMIGRGLLARPWMTGEKQGGDVLKAMHVAVYRQATETLCGDSQILSRLYAFWEYVDVDRKKKKAILKANSLRRYDEAVALILR